MLSCCLLTIALSCLPLWADGTLRLSNEEMIELGDTSYTLDIGVPATRIGYGYVLGLLPPEKGDDQPMELHLIHRPEGKIILSLEKGSGPQSQPLEQVLQVAADSHIRDMHFRIYGDVGTGRFQLWLAERLLCSWSLPSRDESAKLGWSRLWFGGRGLPSDAGYARVQLHAGHSPLVGVESLTGSSPAWTEAQRIPLSHLDQILFHPTSPQHP